MGTFLARVGAAAGVLAAVVACMPLTGANADGCPDADPGMDYCGHCKSTDKCHYCTTGHCVERPASHPDHARDKRASCTRRDDRSGSPRMLLAST